MLITIRLDFSLLDRKDAKILTLQQLYGGILPKYQELEFFGKVKTYVENLWDEFQHQGFIECPISGFKFYRDKLENMNPQKLLNYKLFLSGIEEKRKKERIMLSHMLEYSRTSAFYTSIIL